jgi:hypothetical protein
VRDAPGEVIYVRDEDNGTLPLLSGLSSFRSCLPRVSKAILLLVDLSLRTAAGRGSSTIAASTPFICFLLAGAWQGVSFDRQNNR